MFDAIETAELHPEPVPWFIADDVLPSGLLDEMHRHWPSSGFTPEVPQNYVCDLVTPPDPFWADFKAGPCVSVCQKAISRFWPWISARDGPNVTIEPGYISLMQADPGYPGHIVHTHHYHDPEWCATLLLYLDRDSCGVQGTTLLRSTALNLDEEIRIAAANVPVWRSMKFEEVVTADYMPNRLFAMLDSPISYHCVKPAAPNAVGGRRIFRVHLKAPNHYVQSIYGVPLDTYQNMRWHSPTATTDPIVIGWLKRDLEELRGVKWAG